MPITTRMRKYTIDNSSSLNYSTVMNETTTSYERTVTATFSEPRLSGGGHYAGSLLSCGHEGTCAMNPTVYACAGCGHEQNHCHGCEMNCGYKYNSFRIVLIPDAINPVHRLTKAGDVQTCTTCQRNDADAQRLMDLDEPVFRARYSERWGGQYHLYRRDDTSPTGVMLITTVSATPQIDEILHSKRISPLSPTEDRVR